MIPARVQSLLDKAGAAGWTATEDPDAGPVRLWALDRAGGGVQFWIYWVPGVDGGRVRLYRHEMLIGSVTAHAVDLRRAPFTI